MRGRRNLSLALANGTRPRRHAGSGGEGLGMLQEAPVRSAARAAREAFVRERQGDVALASAQRRLGQGPVDDIALRVAAADLPEIDTHGQQ